MRDKSEPLELFSNITSLVRNQEYLRPPVFDDPGILQNFATRKISDSDDKVPDPWLTEWQIFLISRTMTMNKYEII